MAKVEIVEPKYAEQAFDKLMKLPIDRVEPIDHVAVLRLSISLGIHYYDCQYIMAARELKSTLVSSDEKMVKTAKRVLPQDCAIHIRDIITKSR